MTRAESIIVGCGVAVVSSIYSFIDPEDHPEVTFNFIGFRKDQHLWVCGETLTIKLSGGCMLCDRCLAKLGLKW